jgi:hypothetical protein
MAGALMAISAALPAPARAHGAGHDDPGGAICVPPPDRAAAHGHLQPRCRESHAILSFVASGHVVFFDAGTRQPLRGFRTEVGTGGARQAHAIRPTPDGRHVLVSNPNGKKFERIRTDCAAGVFVQEPQAAPDLAGCTTPHAQPCQAPGVRPDNAPICPFVPASGRIAFVFDGWFICRVRADQALHPSTNAPNQPAREVIDRHERGLRDAHGVARTRNGQYVWFFDRNANVVAIFRSESGHEVGTVNIVDPRKSSDPTPGLVGEAPDGRFMHVSLRGPSPLSGDPQASTGSTPGLLVLEVLQDGRAWAVRGLARITNVDAAGVERADGHGIRVPGTGTRPCSVRHLRVDGSLRRGAPSEVVRSRRRGRLACQHRPRRSPCHGSILTIVGPGRPGTPP